MSALDHFLNGLNAVLKHRERQAELKAAQRAEAAKGRALGVETAKAAAPARFDAPPVIDPSCCLAKRRVKTS